jgi:hypothetical protein
VLKADVGRGAGAEETRGAEVMLRHPEDWKMTKGKEDNYEIGKRRRKK